MRPAQTKSFTLKLVFFSVATLLVMTSVAWRVSAQQATPTPTSTSEDLSSITAVPPRLGDDNSIILNPGEKRQVQVRVINSGNSPMTITTLVEDFIVQDDGFTPIPIGDNGGNSNRWSLSSWLVLTPNEQVVQSRQTAIISVLIEAPADALPGGHYAMITHQPSIPSLEGETGEAAAGINQKVGTLLYVIIAGPINEEAYISNFKIPKFSEFGPVPYSFTVENRSDVHIRPQIGITIKNIFGQTVDTISQEQKNIFPLTTRDFEGKWERIWGFGLYNAELVMSFGDQGKVVISKQQFWLFPVKLVLAAIIILLTAIAMIVSTRRHLIHRKQDQSKQIADLESKLQQLERDKLKKYEE